MSFTACQIGPSLSYWFHLRRWSRWGCALTRPLGAQGPVGEPDDAGEAGPRDRGSRHASRAGDAGGTCHMLHDPSIPSHPILSHPMLCYPIIPFRSVIPIVCNAGGALCRTTPPSILLVNAVEGHAKAGRLGASLHTPYTQSLFFFLVHSRPSVSSCMCAQAVATSVACCGGWARRAGERQILSKGVSPVQWLSILGRCINAAVNGDPLVSVCPAICPQ
jgi:hypothetical protein